MKNDLAVSEVMSEVLIIIAILGLAAVVAVVVFGFAPGNADASHMVSLKATHTSTGITLVLTGAQMPDKVSFTLHTTIDGVKKADWSPDTIGAQQSFPVTSSGKVRTQVVAVYSDGFSATVFDEIV